MTRLRTLLLLLIILWAVNLPPWEAGAASVVAVEDGDTVILDDGRKVRLVGIQAPKTGLAEEARAALAALVSGQEVELRPEGRAVDRHGRTLAHLFVGGVWVQGEMLGRGLARVYTLADNRTRAEEMYAKEQTARAERLGLWRHPAFAVRTPEESGRLLGTFQVVAGRVENAARAQGRIYLNFGSDWRNDFTVVIPSDASALFHKAGIDPLTWKGRIVQVRGWLDSYNGPMITVSHPEQIKPEQIKPEQIKIEPDPDPK